MVKNLDRKSKRLLIEDAPRRAEEGFLAFNDVVREIETFLNCAQLNCYSIRLGGRRVSKVINLLLPLAALLPFANFRLKTIIDRLQSDS